MILETNGVTITFPSGRVVEDHEVTVAKLKNWAKEEGLKKCVAKLNGTPIKGSDYPITSGEIAVEAYNEAKQG